MEEEFSGREAEQEQLPDKRMEVEFSGREAEQEQLPDKMDGGGVLR